MVRPLAANCRACKKEVFTLLDSMLLQKYKTNQDPGNVIQNLSDRSSSMEMRASEDINIGQDLTPPLPPLASSLYSATLTSFCSACFSPLPPSPHLPSATPPFFQSPNHVPTPLYCSLRCSSLDSPLHFSSFESQLLNQSPPSMRPDSSDLRLSLRLLHIFQKSTTTSIRPQSLCVLEKAKNFEKDVLVERIGGLMTNRENLFVRKEDQNVQNDDDILKRIKEGVKALAAARGKNDAFVGLEEEEAVLCLVLTNAVEVQDNCGRGIGVAVYDNKFSWINHSCSPNACYRFTTRPDDAGASRLRICPTTSDGGGNKGSEVQDECHRGREVYGPRIVLRCIKEIHTGEEVTITYTDLLQPKAVRRSELWLKYRFDCCCKRCSVIPATCVDRILQETFGDNLYCQSSASDGKYHNQETLSNLEDLYEDAVINYLSNNDPKACCQKLEDLLTHGYVAKQAEPERTESQHRVVLHPLHHLALNSYMILASAYKVRAYDVLDLKSESESYQPEAFNLMRASAAYILMLAGASNFLLQSEGSLIVTVANFWISAGDSLMSFARSQIWDLYLKRPSLSGSATLSNYNCFKCSLLNRFRSLIDSQERDGQHEEMGSQIFSCIVDMTSKLWNYLVPEGSYLRKVKDPVDLRWLKTMDSAMKESASASRVDDGMEPSNQERMDFSQLGIHCLLYGAFMASICYGRHSHLTRNVKDILKSEGVLIT